MMSKSVGEGSPTTPWRITSDSRRDADLGLRRLAAAAWATTAKRDMVAKANFILESEKSIVTRGRNGTGEST